MKQKNFYELTNSFFRRVDDLCFLKKETKDKKYAQKCIELAKKYIKEQKYRYAQFCLTCAENILITIPNKKEVKA